MKARAEYVEMYKKQQQEQETAMYSFKPSINPNSKKLIAHTRTEKPEDGYKTFRKALEARTEREKQAQRIREMQECSFAPQISHRGPARKTQVPTKATAAETIFTSLYEEAKTRDSKREEYAKKMSGFCVCV